MPPRSAPTAEPRIRFRLSYTLDGAHTGTPRIFLAGELSILTADRARAAIEDAQREAHDLICDLTDVTYIDVPGVCVLVDLAARAQHHGDILRIFGLQGNPSVFVSRNRSICLIGGRAGECRAMNESQTQKVLQYLNEAHAMEHALVRVLQSQIAMTPRGTYRVGPRDAISARPGITPGGSVAG